MDHEVLWDGGESTVMASLNDDSHPGLVTIHQRQYTNVRKLNTGGQPFGVQDTVCSRSRETSGRRRAVRLKSHDFSYKSAGCYVAREANPVRHPAIQRLPLDTCRPRGSESIVQLGLSTRACSSRIIVGLDRCLLNVSQQERTGGPT